MTLVVALVLLPWGAYGVASALVAGQLSAFLVNWTSYFRAMRSASTSTPLGDTRPLLASVVITTYRRIDMLGDALEMQADWLSRRACGMNY